MKHKQKRVAQVLHAFGVAVRFASQPGQVAAQPVVHTLDGVGVRLALEVALLVEDGAVAGELVAGVSD